MWMYKISVPEQYLEEIGNIELELSGKPSVLKFPSFGFEWQEPNDRRAGLEALLRSVSYYWKHEPMQCHQTIPDNKVFKLKNLG